MWLRWAWRDLRGHWVAVIVIGLILAIGMGVFAGLGRTSTWRRESNDASFALLGLHDLRAELSPGTFAAEGELLAAVGAVDTVDEVRERLVVDSQLDASTADTSVLVQARIVGMDLHATPPLDAVWVRDGHLPSDDSEAVLEAKFADAWGLPERGTVALAGDQPIRYTGLGMTPEDFFYEGPVGTIFSDGELAPVYVPLPLAQRVTGRAGQVNDVVVAVSDGVDPAAAADELREALAAAGVGATVSTRDDSYAYRVLYEDIDNDQRTWNAIAALVLGSAALAAFNLISRIVEAQRREIGIGMALGVPRWRLAIRPMLVGAEVALVGTAAGIAIGLLIGQAMANLFESFVPLPVYRLDFQIDVYARAAVLGLAIPLVASAIPVWRAVRVQPIKSIRVGHLAARPSRLTDWTAGLSLPGSSLTQMPVRNVLRTPRRTLLTVVGIGAAITALVGVLGLLDSFGRTIDQTGSELTKGDPDRVFIQLDTFYPSSSGVVEAIEETPSTAATDLGLRLPVDALAAADDRDDLELLVELVDFDTATWTPTVTTGIADGLVLSSKAADDLGVKAGDVLRIRHPARTSATSWELTASSVTVSGLHANPVRGFAYMDLHHAGLFGLEGATNVVNAYPSAGADRADVQREVFGLPGVASSQAVARISESFDEALDQFVGFLVISAVAVLALASLIAFNSSRISMEERRREHATMRAFGLPVRSVAAVVVKESVIIGVLATAIGVMAGLAFLGWMLSSVTSTTLPDLAIEIYLSPTTIGLALAVGLVAAAGAPLLLIWRVRKMDIPSTLRVME